MDCTAFVAEKIGELNIAVIGDVMVDRYFYGDVQRISPEAPVPVNKINKSKSVPGGAANVAANLACLGCHVHMGSIVGNDESCTELEKMLDDLGVDHKGFVKSEDKETVTKLRILSGGQQMMRLDFEDIKEPERKEIADICLWLKALIDKGLNGIVVSDYAKGMCSDELCRKIIQLAKKYAVPVLVDPKGDNWDKYYGCNFITPNLKELSEFMGETVANEDIPVVQFGQAAKERLNINNVLITRSEKGITVVGENKTVLHSPATVLEVFDVSGAGDTVAACVIAAVAGKMPLADAIYMANRAAGIAVRKVGTYPVSRSELLRELYSAERKAERGSRALSFKEAENLVKGWRKNGESVVFTNGCFDIIHTGHVSYLEKAAQSGDHLIIGLNSDASVRRLKGASRPLVNEKDRARVLAALACVDAVVIFEEDTPKNLVKLIRPDVLAKGGDYKPEEVAGREYAGRVEIVEFEKGYSTTGLVEKIAELVRAGKI